MATYAEKLLPKEWEAFCAIMLRYHYKAENFWEVPDEDTGDLGLEFLLSMKRFFSAITQNCGKARNIIFALYRVCLQRISPGGR